MDPEDGLSVSANSFVAILSSQEKKTSPINNSSDIYLTISKSTHHPTNKKPHECGANLNASISHYYI